MKSRHLLLAVAAAISAWLAWSAPGQTAASTAPAVATVIVREPQYTLAAGLQSELTQAKQARSTTNTLFQLPPPPPPVAMAPVVTAPILPPPPPLPPALPFRFLGRISDEDGVRVFLQYKDDLFYAAAGQKISLDYQVVDISAHAITFLYLPQNIQQELRIND